MEYAELIITSFQALRRNVLRTLLTMLGIIIGISSVITIISIGQGATQAITQEVSAFGTNLISVVPGSFGDQSAFTGNVKTLTIDDAEAIEDESSLSNVDKVSAFVSSPQQVSANGQNERMTINGVSATFAEISNSTIEYGEFIREVDEVGNAKVAVLGTETVTEFFGEEADPVGETIKIDNRIYNIVGVLKSPDSAFGGFVNQAIYIPNTTMMNLILGQDHVNEIQVSVENSDLTNQTINNLEIFLRDRHGLVEGEENDFTIQSSESALDILETVTGLLTALLSAIATISLIVGGVGIMNIMLVTVTERTKEIGLLKAIGATQKDILTQFLIESVVLTVSGGIIGIILGLLVSFVVSQIAGFPFIISIPAIIIATVASSAVGILFGMYPARKAAKLSPIVALRYE